MRGTNDVPQLRRDPAIEAIAGNIHGYGSPAREIAKPVVD